MKIRWRVEDDDGCHPVNLTFNTYDEASDMARRIAKRGTTTVIYKVIPCARFVAQVTVEAQEDEALCGA